MIKYIKSSWNGEHEHTKDKEVYDYLNELKQKKGRDITLIDIGGAAKLRIPEYTTHILDFQPEKLKNDNVIKFGGDMELNDTWTPIFKYVEKNGKFDFVVCTHTLEDLNAPIQVILNLFKIADAGLIAVPTKYMDTKRWEGNYLGYHHHRWIYTIKNKVFCGYPKMGLMEHVNFNFASSQAYHNKFGDLQTEIAFLWEENFEMDFTPPYQYNDNFTHPEKKSKLVDLMEYDDIDELFLKG